MIDVRIDSGMEMARRVRRLFYCWVAILIAILVLSSNHASATSIVFTSTADFDAGTKSDPGDGNYGAETVTDNPAIPADQFQSGNIAGDSFSHSDADGNTFKWTKIQTEGSGSDSYSITSGSLDLKWTSALNAEQTDEFSTAKITGDFDIRTLVTSVSSNNNFDGFQWYLLRNQGAFSGGSQDGVGIRWDHGTNARFRSAKIVSGSLTVLNTHADCGATCYLRMTRSTNDFTFYYSADGSSWTTITTATTLSNVPASVYIDLSAERLSLLAEEWTVDSIWLQSGTVASGGFRTSGVRLPVRDGRVFRWHHDFLLRRVVQQLHLCHQSLRLHVILFLYQQSASHLRILAFLRDSECPQHAHLEGPGQAHL